MHYYKEDRLRAQDPDISPNIHRGRIEVISGSLISTTQNGVEEVFVESVEGYDIYTEVEGDVMPDWLEYADLRRYACLSHLKRYDYMERKEDLFEALRYLHDFSLLWDGQGFNDKDFTVEGKYALFKNAMFAYCVKLLDKISRPESELYSLPETIEYQDIHKILPEVESMLWKAQDLGSGGFHPHYISGTSLGEVNAETTAWVLLAYEWLVSDSSFNI
jgi:hypothetical protein